MKHLYFSVCRWWLAPSSSSCPASSGSPSPPRPAWTSCTGWWTPWPPGGDLSPLRSSSQTRSLTLLSSTSHILGNRTFYVYNVSTKLCFMHQILFPRSPGPDLLEPGAPPQPSAQGCHHRRHLLHGEAELRRPQGPPGAARQVSPESAVPV